MGVIWTPQPKQLEFMMRPEYEALFGGAAGGGKSDTLLMEALRQINNPGYRGLILRKAMTHCYELIDRSKALYPFAVKGARYSQSSHCWQFPSGAKIYFGSMPHSEDRFKYQGQSYDYIALDELTHFTQQEYTYMFSRNRPSAPGTRVYIRASANPGGIGHQWVKQRFIDPAPPLTPICEEFDILIGQQPQTLKRDRIFVPSTVFDNQVLLHRNPAYLANLSMLPEAEKQALLYGSWTSFSGQVFTEWKDDPAHYEDRRWTHVIAPFRIPADYRIYRGFDFGYSKPFSVGWYAADREGKLYRIAEFYGCDGTPDQGIRMEPHEIAREIRRIESEDPNLKNRVITGIADPAIFDESRGESVARMMERSPAFIYFSKGDHTRLAGKMQFHYRLAFNEEGFPMFQCFNTCKNFIRTLPALIYDPRHPEDIDTRGEDHIYDECRYVFMENPIAPVRQQPSQRPLDDPLDLYNHPKR